MCKPHRVRNLLTGVVAFAVVLSASAGTPCHADFNASGSLSVQDLFDFLEAYFEVLPTADFNGSGALSVQDIFDFLAAFFAGCP